MRIVSSSVHIPSHLLPDDTIVAPATAPGEGAIAIVRLSGREAWPLASRLAPFLRPDTPARMALFGLIRTPDGISDEALLLPFRGPHSYTGEDLVEFHLHGNDLLVSAVTQALVRFGARPATPGEFTRRAFLHGKMDLTRAEAVAELIAAKSERAARGAAARLSGALAQRYQALRRQLLDMLVHLEAEIDFPEEDLETLAYPRLQSDAHRIRTELQALAHSYTQGRIERDGLRVAIVGRPNSGKSSLLNALLGVERAIVTPYAGTTRDYLEETLRLSGVSLQIVDTAGLRKTDDPVEREGIRRTHQLVSEADVVLHVVDATEGSWEELSLAPTTQQVWVVNKVDCVSQRPRPGEPCFYVSALTREGIPELAAWLERTAKGQDSDVGVRVASARQERLLRRASASLEKVEQVLEEGLSPEFVVSDLRDAIEAVGELTGDIVTDEVLGEIFSRFCIGK